MKITTIAYYYERYSLLNICCCMYNLYLCIQLIYIFMVCQSAEMADNKEDSREQATPSVINGHYDYVQGIRSSWEVVPLLAQNKTYDCIEVSSRSTVHWTGRFYCLTPVLCILCYRCRSLQSCRLYWSQCVDHLREYQDYHS